MSLSLSLHEGDDNDIFPSPPHSPSPPILTPNSEFSFTSPREGLEGRHTPEQLILQTNHDSPPATNKIDPKRRWQINRSSPDDSLVHDLKEYSSSFNSQMLSLADTTAGISAEVTPRSGDIFSPSPFKSPVVEYLGIENNGTHKAGNMKAENSGLSSTRPDSQAVERQAIIIAPKQWTCNGEAGLEIGPSSGPQTAHTDPRVNMQPPAYQSYGISWNLAKYMNSHIEDPLVQGHHPRAGLHKCRKPRLKNETRGTGYFGCSNRILRVVTSHDSKENNATYDRHVCEQAMRQAATKWPSPRPLFYDPNTNRCWDATLEMSPNPWLTSAVDMVLALIHGQCAGYFRPLLLTDNLLSVMTDVCVNIGSEEIVRHVANHCLSWRLANPPLCQNLQQWSALLKNAKYYKRTDVLAAVTRELITFGASGDFEDTDSCGNPNINHEEKSTVFPPLIAAIREARELALRDVVAVVEEMLLGNCGECLIGGRPDDHTHKTSSSATLRRFEFVDWRSLIKRTDISLADIVSMIKSVGCTNIESSLRRPSNRRSLDSDDTALKLMYGKLDKIVSREHLTHC